MAKAIGKLNPALIPKNAFKYTTVRQVHNGIVLLSGKNKPRNPSPELKTNAQLVAWLAPQWLRIATWKRERWATCAAQHNKTAFAFYLTCAIEQGVQPWQQPISPCSRRETDPDCPPGDFTP